jgi:hypothetical protein
MKPAEIKRRVEAGTTSPAPGLSVRPSYKLDGAVQLVVDTTDAHLRNPTRTFLGMCMIDIPDPEALLRSIKRAAAYAKRMRRQKGAAA